MKKKINKINKNQVQLPYVKEVLQPWFEVQLASQCLYVGVFGLMCLFLNMLIGMNVIMQKKTDWAVNKVTEKNSAAP